MIGKLIALVLPLGLDTFAVCCALGMAGIPASRRNRISALMVAFEAGMPLIGLALGVPVGRAIGGAADYVAIVVLAAFGLYTILGEEDEESAAQLITASGWRLVLLGVSISLDELAVGFTLGLLRLPVAIVILAVALQTIVIAQLGMRLGGRLGGRVREGAERLAGVALTGLAAILLIEQLAA
ncbi:MAG: manganese efflux pump [Acidobacteriota bacterium]|nr:manganese efflux pump [Acidobacteriota bacterium]